MNPYITGGMALVIIILGWQLKASVTRNGELAAKLENQVSETQECADANVTTVGTVTALESRIATMIEERRVDTAIREEVLDERSQELLRANAVADQLRQERDHEIDDKPDCADLASLSVSFFCPDTGEQLRERSRGPGSNGDQASN